MCLKLISSLCAEEFDMDFHKQVFYPFIKKAICPLGICLSSLYNNDVTQQIVRAVVEDRFELLFDQYIDIAKKKKIKVSDMVNKKSVMKNLFVEFGLPLESTDDLIFLAITADQMDSIPNYFSFYDMRDHILKTVQLKNDFAETHGTKENESRERLVDVAECDHENEYTPMNDPDGSYDDNN